MPDLEPDVIGEWIRRYTPRLKAVAEAFADGETEADDILQEVWLIALKKGGRLGPNSHVGAWLHQITLNIGRQTMRRRKRRQALRTRRMTPPDPPRPSPTIRAALHRGELWRAVAELPALQRRVLLLRVVEEMSVRDVAETLNRAEGTVKASLSRALATLRGQALIDGSAWPDLVREGAHAWQLDG